MHVHTAHRNRTWRMLSVLLYLRFCCETIFMDTRTAFFLRMYGKIFCHTVDVSPMKALLHGSCAIPSCQCHFAVHACYVMIILPYTSTHQIETLCHRWQRRRPSLVFSGIYFNDAAQSLNAIRKHRKTDSSWIKSPLHKAFTKPRLFRIAAI